jgi:hypothetical protein
MEILDRAAPVRARVCADGVVAEYMRAGTGRPVVVLVPSDGWPAIADVLATRSGGRCRLIVPDSRPPSETLDDWLAAFADGLGVAGAVLVVAEPLGGAARAFAEREVDLVSRIVVLREPATAAPALERVERVGIPLLVLTIPAGDVEKAEGQEALLDFVAAFPTG